MNKHALAALLAALPAASCDQFGGARGGGASGPVEIKTEEQKTLYALGAILGSNVTPFSLTAQELAVVQAGMSDQVLGRKLQVEMSVFGPKVNQLAEARSRKRAEGEKAGAKDFLDKAAREEGAVKLPSGLVYKTLKAGTGPSPTAEDRVKVHYHGTLTSGKVFDSSVQRGEPAEFPLKGVIPCWTEGVQRMKVGEKARLVCPSEIAYGEMGRPPVIPGSATLIFEVELLEITGKTAAPASIPPAEAKGAPKDAARPADKKPGAAQ